MRNLIGTKHKNRTHPECWACGKLCPRRTHIEREGWVSRPIRLGGGDARETYCRECFAKWGWPESEGA